MKERFNNFWNPLYDTIQCLTIEFSLSNQQREQHPTSFTELIITYKKLTENEEIKKDIR